MMLRNNKEKNGTKSTFIDDKVKKNHEKLKSNIADVDSYF